MNFLYLSKMYDSEEDMKKDIEFMKKQADKKGSALLYDVRDLCIIYIVVPKNWDEVIRESVRRVKDAQSFYA